MAIKETPLKQKHILLNARMTDYAGWLMPIQYSNIIEEHKAVRSSCGIFDVSHMGILNVSGKDAYDFLQFITTNDLAKISDGQAIYSLMCNFEGGIVDDLIVYQCTKYNFRIIVNASNVDSDEAWLRKHVFSRDVLIENKNDDYALLAVQGPKSNLILKQIFDGFNLKPFFHEEYSFLGETGWIAATGYTGEIGFEVCFKKNIICQLWDKILEVGQEFAIKPIGLGARDILRLEMKYMLYGSDISEKTTPFEAKLKWAVALHKNDFVGKDALLHLKDKTTKHLIGFKMIDQAIPRSGYSVLAEDATVIGKVTSGGFSPSLDKGIGLAYVQLEYDCLGKKIFIQIRKKVFEAEVVGSNFLKNLTKKNNFNSVMV